MDVGKIVDVLVLGTRGRGSGLAGQRMVVVLVVAVLVVSPLHPAVHGVKIAASQDLNGLLLLMRMVVLLLLLLLLSRRGSVRWLSILSRRTVVHLLLIDPTAVIAVVAVFPTEVRVAHALLVRMLLLGVMLLLLVLVLMLVLLVGILGIAVALLLLMVAIPNRLMAILLP